MDNTTYHTTHCNMWQHRGFRCEVDNGTRHLFCCEEERVRWTRNHPYYEQEMKRPSFWVLVLVAIALTVFSWTVAAEDLDYFPKGATVYVDGFPVCYQQEWAEAVAQTHYENGVEQATDLFSKLSQQRECGIPTMGTALIVGEMVYSNDTVRVIEMLGAPVPVYLITTMKWRPGELI